MPSPSYDVYGFVRGANDGFNFGSGQEIPINLNNRGDQLVALSLPTYAELARMGAVWSMRVATGSAFNAVAALPTTLAAMILYNNEPVGGKSYVLFNAWATTIVAAAASTQYSLLAQVTPSPLGVSTAPTHSATTTLLTSRSGKANYTGNAKRAVAVTTFFTDGWDVIAASGTAAAANIGMGVYADLQGSIVIPPGGSFGLNLIASTVNAAGCIVGCTWAEVQLLLG